MKDEPLLIRSLGKGISRVDGPLKVTGRAKYPAEFKPPESAYGYLVTSAISKGSIQNIDISNAEKAPGVFAVVTPMNAPKLAEPPNDKKSEGIRVEERIPLSDDKISYGGQYVAMVVADTFERARYAASLLRIIYNEEKPALTKEDAAATAKKPKDNQGEKLQVLKGNVEGTLKDPSLVKIEQIYSTPVETHNPIECSATVAIWTDAEHLVIYDATQYVKGSQAEVADAFGLKRENVRVICPFVGGAFGCKGPVWPHTFLAAMAAKIVKRPVRVEVTRQQMFSTIGHRPPTVQTIALAASKDGMLQAMRHSTEVVTSPVGAFIEPCGIGSTNVMYDAPAIEFTHALYQVNVGQPSFMRAPGECPGMYALESAMDELSYALGIDPVQLRLLNESKKHPIKDIPWSSKNFAECCELGMEKFDWKRRNPKPRSMKSGEFLVGLGMASATYPANKWDADVLIKLRAKGDAIVQCAAHDLGTGAYTACTQISADAIGLPVEAVTFQLGMSDFPLGPAAGGSNTTATMSAGIVAAARKLHEKLSELAVADSASPLFKAKSDDIRLVETGRLGLASDPSRSQTFSEILARAKLNEIEVIGSTKEKKSTSMAFQSFGAQFCEVHVDPDLLQVKVMRFVSVMDCGQVINHKTASSQIIGGVVMGIGMALLEETHYDPKTGVPVTRNLADYHVPVNADIIAIEPYFVGKPDYAFNPVGARGMGEIGNTGSAAAVANAVYHATGTRVRDLPITMDKLLG